MINFFGPRASQVPFKTQASMARGPHVVWAGPRAGFLYSMYVP